MYVGNTSVVPPSFYNVVAKGDSAASGHYFRERDAHILTNKRPASEPQVILPDNDTITPTLTELYRHLVEFMTFHDYIL